MPPLDAAPAPAPAPVTISSLLVEHQNDAHRALATLVSRHNRLVTEHATLRQLHDAAVQASERAAQENQQLWRSLKALGSASPRPSTQRQNSDHSAAQGVRGLGLETPTSRGLRRGPSSDSNTTTRLDLPPSASGSGTTSHQSSPRFDGDLAHFPETPHSGGGGGAPSSGEPSPRFPAAAQFSPAGVRTKAATPPPSHGSPRQHDALTASALRKASLLDLGRGPDAPGAGQAGPTDSLRLPEQLPKTPPQAEKAFLMRRRQSSPRIPGSASMPMLSDPAADRRFLPSIQPVSPFFGDDAQRNPPRETISASTSAGEHLQQQLQLPRADAARRDRTFSNTSSTSLSAAFSDHPTPHSGSVHTLPDAPPPPPPPSSSYSARDRRPSAPTSRLAHEGDGSASSSRRPSALSLSAASLQQPLPPPPPRTPTPQARAAPSLTPALVPHTRVRVGSSNIRLNERSKEVISFVIDVEVDGGEGGGRAARWRVEKRYSDVLALDAQVKSKTNRQESRSMASLPDKSLFKDHAPHKSDQRKAVLERYLQTLLAIPLRDRAAICAFFTSDVLPDEPTTPSSANGAIEGWLTKRGRNFGGWQTRFYVLTPGSALAYYDAPGGTKLGEIPLHAAAIGRQSSRATDAGEDAYLHAFLIRTQTDKEHDADHILCAENDDARDRWVQALTTLQPRAGAAAKANGLVAPGAAEKAQPALPLSAQQQVPTLVSPDTDSPPSAPKERRRSGSGPPSSAGLEQAAGAPTQSGGLSARTAGELPPSVSLPSNLDGLARGMPALEGAASKKISTISEVGEAGVPAASASSSQRGAGGKLQAPASRRPSADRPLSPSRADSGGPVPQLPTVTKYSASDVSGPMNAVPLPSGYDFKKAERAKKTKSSFWAFASRNSSDKNASTSPVQQVAAPARPVFGVPLTEAVAISRIRPGLELPAIVYRCVEYLEAKNAEHEEGIFRLSGSANVIRLLKERFNAEGDVNLLQSAEYYDPHAVAGLLKQYLRELPGHLLTRELHNEFIRVIDLRDRRDRVNALGKLVARLPIEEYTLFRFFFAHLCLIAQNADTSKMNLRNLGIVFAPTLAIPQPLFSLFLVEFDLIFAVETETGTARPIMVDDEPAAAAAAAEEAAVDASGRPANRNSQLYEASGAGELEQKLEKLREHDEGDDDAASEHPDESDQAEDLLIEDEPEPASPYANPALASLALGVPPRSPGLPSSPRPGATF
ncbi:Rho GTPase activating protein [Rhodotorula kratochvilovae]